MPMVRTDALLKDFAVAMVLLTRLPMPRLADDAFAHQARAVWAFPLVGLLVGGIGATIFAAALTFGIPAAVGAGLALITLTLITGALHEDGLADTADGLWGGHTKEDRLRIMKDSRVGVYGVVALVFVTGLRWAALTAAGPLALMVSTTVSRAAMPALMHALPNARAEGLSHAVGRPPRAAVLAALVLAVGVGVAVLGLGSLIAFLCAALAVLWLARTAQRRIGGQTGDILGASQQVAEVAILVVLSAR